MTARELWPMTQEHGTAAATDDLRWITKKELAHALGMSVSFIDKQMRLGLPKQRWGRKAVRFRLRDVVPWLERNSA